MLAISAGETITLWNHAHHKSFSYQPILNDSPISELSWNEDGTKIASCSTSLEHPNIAITPINHDGTASKQLVFHSSCLDCSDTITFTCSKTASEATSVSFEGNKHLCVLAGSDISIFDLEKGARVELLKLPTLCSKTCMSGSQVAAASKSDESVYIYQLKGGAWSTTPTILSPFSNNRQVKCNALSFSTQTSNLAAVGLSNGSIYIWDTAYGTLKSTIDSETEHTSSISDLCFSPINSRLLASCSEDKLLFHDSMSGKSIATIKLPESAACTSLDLANDGVSCAVGTSAGTVLLFDLRKTSGTPVAQWFSRKESNYQDVTCVRFQRTTQSNSVIHSKSNTGANVVTKCPEPAIKESESRVLNTDFRQEKAVIGTPCPKDDAIESIDAASCVEMNFLLDLAKLGRLPMATPKKQASHKAKEDKENNHFLINNKVSCTCVRMTTRCQVFDYLALNVLLSGRIKFAIYKTTSKNRRRPQRD
jgi:WD40 repeat protein